MSDSPQRRRLLGMAVATSLLGMSGAAGARAGRRERQRGDPDLPPESIQIEDEVIKALVGPSRASFQPRPPNFGALLLAEAGTWVGKNRADNQADITRLLQLFQLQFRDADGLVPFCAAGVSFVAGMVYARRAATSTGDITLGTLGSYLAEVDHYHFYPTPSVHDMTLVAQGHRTWRPRTDAAKIKPGGLVVFDWDKDGIGDHVGIVESVAGDHVNTIEFNTSAAASAGSTASNRQGGAVARKQRPLAGGTIKGFITV